MAGIFSTVPAGIPKKNAFNLSHNVKLTCEMGTLVPVFVQDVLPNDTFKISAQNLVRFAPMLAPIMSEVDVYLHFFFVPNRLIWSDWTTFITGSKNGKSIPEDELPSKPRFVFAGQALNQAINSSNWTSEGTTALGNRSLADYLGFQTFPSGTTFNNGEYALDALPFRAYYKIWSDFYRDENLSEDVLADYIDFSGDQSPTNQTLDQFQQFLSLRRRAWKKDYFTSALPFSQKGEDVLIPGSGQSLDGKLYVEGSPLFSLSSAGEFSSPVNADNGFGSNQSRDNVGLKVGGTQLKFAGKDGFDVRNFSRAHVNLSDIQNSSVGEGTIRELRRAFAAQKFLERRAVGGTRYQEQNLAFFGIRGSDARLQRAEFLGGTKNPVVVSQLLQTSQSTDTSPLGTPAGNAVSAGGNFIFKKTFEEYGFIMGIMSIMPRADYMEGIPKMYLKRDVYDYYWPQFAHVGEQPIENQELYFNPTADNSVNQGTFGYTPRYAEYRFRNNRVCGDFKDSLKFWTLARDFNSTPVLNQSFIECNPSTRVFAVEDTGYSHCWVECSFNVMALRPLPKYAEAL